MTKFQGWLLVAAIVLIGIVLIVQGSAAAHNDYCEGKAGSIIYPECG